MREQRSHFRERPNACRSEITKKEMPGLLRVLRGEFVASSPDLLSNRNNRDTNGQSRTGLKKVGPVGFCLYTNCGSNSNFILKLGTILEVPQIVFNHRKEYQSSETEKNNYFESRECKFCKKV